MTTAEVLREARALIDTPEKWTKGYRGERLCAVAAIASAAPRDWLPAKYALNRALGREESVVLYRWNDDPATTHADVLAAFDRAIALAEAQS